MQVPKGRGGDDDVCPDEFRGNSIVKGQICVEGAGNGSNPTDPCLESGMSAGVVGKLWSFEFPTSVGNPGASAFDGTPFTEVGSFDDLIKVKVGDAGVDTPLGDWAWW